MTAVTRIHHIGVVVRSIDDAFAFFRDTLGLSLLKEEAVAEQGVRAALLDLGGPALSEVEGSFLELLEPTVPDTGIARYLERRGEGLHHVCLEVPDIDAALAGLKADGVPLIDETPRPGITGAIAFLHPSALHGVLVELVHGPTAYAARDPRPATRDPGGAGAGGASILRLDHLIIAVQELHEAAASWAHVLGLQAEAPHHPEGSHLELARLPLSDDAQGGAFLELVAVREDAAPTEDQAHHPRPATRDPRPGGAQHRLARFIAERGEGMFSVSLEVAGLDAAVRDLRARGLPVSDPVPGPWGAGPRPEQRRRVARIPRASAHGVAIQLIERNT